MSCLGQSLKSFKIISGPKVIEDLVKTLKKLLIEWHLMVLEGFHRILTHQFIILTSSPQKSIHSKRYVNSLIWAIPIFYAWILYKINIFYVSSKCISCNKMSSTEKKSKTFGHLMVMIFYTKKLSYTVTHKGWCINIYWRYLGFFPCFH